MAQGGRIVLKKDGTEKSRHHIDPQSRDPKAKPDDAAVAAAHNYKTGAHKNFVELSAEDRAERAAKAAAKPGNPSNTNPGSK